MATIIKGGQAVNEGGGTHHGFDQCRSKKIVDIISVIQGIAFQTNILVLNAAVEAATAELMRELANELFNAVSAFKLGGRKDARTAIMPPAAEAPATEPLRKESKLIKAKADVESDWKEF